MTMVTLYPHDQASDLDETSYVLIYIPYQLGPKTQQARDAKDETSFNTNE